MKLCFALVAFLLLTGCSIQGTPPPELNRPYPEMQLFDETGQTIPFSSFRGKVTLLHAVSMGCPMCQALSGADNFGPYGTVMPNVELSSLDYYLSRSVPEAAANPNFQIIQIVFYNTHGEPPSVSELADWSRHFHFRERGIVVLGAPMAVSETIGRVLVPGFQLLDRNQVLRADSTGISPRHDFKKQILPGLRTLLKREAAR